MVKDVGGGKVAENHEETKNAQPTSEHAGGNIPPGLEVGEGAWSDTVSLSSQRDGDNHILYIHASSHRE